MHNLFANAAKRSRSVSPTESIHAAALDVFDMLLAAVIFAAPLFMGGRGPLGKFVLVALVGGAAIAWLVRQYTARQPRWTFTGVEWLLAAGLIVVVLQLIPMSQSLLLVLSPSLDDLLPLWMSDDSAPGGLGRWKTVSLTPEATRAGLEVYAAYAMLFLLVVQRTATLADVQRLLRWIALGAVFMAVLGLAQLLFGNGKFLWLYEHPSRSSAGAVKGAFHNPNHFAHFLALGLGPLIWWTWHTISRLRSGDRARSMWIQAAGVRSLSPVHLLVVALGLLAVAGLLTNSRGGVVSMAAAALVCVTVYLYKSLLTKRSLIVIAGIAAITAASLSIHGYEPLARKLKILQSASSMEDLSQGRRHLWSALVEAIPHFAVLGSGIGSHREVYPVYLEKHFDVEFTHGESGYLPLLLEAGWPGLILMLTGSAVCLMWIWRILRRRIDPAMQTREERHSINESFACAGAIGAALLVSVLHSIVDFVWYLSACMSVTVILAGCACQLRRISQSDFRPRQSQPRIWARFFTANTAPLTHVAVAGLLALAVVVSAAITLDYLPRAMAAPHWQQYLRVSLKAKQLSPSQQQEAIEAAQQMAISLERVLSLDPNHPRANMRIASLYLRRFNLKQQHCDNPMVLSQIRDAAIASQFPNRKAQDEWLSRAVGDNRRLLDRALVHCRRGLQRSPLQGQGYIHLAKLSFLDSPQPDARERFVAQAQIVRPNDGMVLFAIGNDKALAGELDAAIACWKRAFHQDPEARSSIVETFAAQVPAEFLLSQFEPDSAGLAELYAFYRRQQQDDQARYVGSFYAQSLRRSARGAPPEEAARFSIEASRVLEFLGDYEQAAEAAQLAVQLSGNQFEARRHLAAVLMKSGRHDEAIEHLQWCLYRSPDNSSVKRDLLESQREKNRRQAAKDVAERPFSALPR